MRGPLSAHCPPVGPLNCTSSFYKELVSSIRPSTLLGYYVYSYHDDRLIRGNSAQLVLNSVGSVLQSEDQSREISSGSVPIYEHRVHRHSSGLQIGKGLPSSRKISELIPPHLIASIISMSINKNLLEATRPHGLMYPGDTFCQMDTETSSILNQVYLSSNFAQHELSSHDPLVESHVPSLVARSEQHLMEDACPPLPDIFHPDTGHSHFHKGLVCTSGQLTTHGIWNSTHPSAHINDIHSP